MKRRFMLYPHEEIGTGFHWVARELAPGEIPDKDAVYTEESEYDYCLCTGEQPNPCPLHPDSKIIRRGTFG